MYKRELNFEDYLLFSEKSLEYEVNIKDPTDISDIFNKNKNNV